jgi:cell wall assembly regulator SMI1
MGGAGEHGVDRLWNRIETWLSANAPALAAGFHPPATARKLAATEQLLGVQLPEDARLSYLRHNGHWSLFGGWEWYSLEGIRRSWTVWNDLLAEGCFAGKRNTSDGSMVRQDWWHPGWIPLAHLESDEICLDCAPGPQGTVGQIIEMWHDEGQRPVVATSFREWLTDFADDLERGVYVVCQTTGELDHRDCLWATLARRGDRRKQEGWHVAIDLARQFGWEPAGTRPPRGVRVADWDAEDYTSREGQQVTGADALALAATLGRALKTIPKGRAALPPEGASPALAFFTGHTRGELAGLVQYCKRGAFRVTDDL